MTTFSNQVRKEFPILSRKINQRPLVYLDNAATTQKPACVLQRLQTYYENENSNIHRGAHFLSSQATEAYENARKTIKAYVNAAYAHEIIFTRGTTEAINLVASSFCKKFVKEGDEIVISAMEHHANIVPWQLACQDHKARLKVIPMNDAGELDMEAYEKLLSDKTRLVAVTHVSNALGSINPVRDLIDIAHKKNIAVLIDGAQATPHTAVDVQALDCDFYCFSGHKMYGPMGVGVLYGKEQWLNDMPPYQGGGEMISEVTFEKTSFNDLPFKFEAGTPNVADVLGMETAVRFLSELGLRHIEAHEKDLLQYATARMQEIDNIRLVGTAKNKTGVISFLFNDIHPYDTGTILDKMGIAVRTGHHCAQPVMDFFGIPGTVRVSFGLYNTRNEVDILVEGLKKVRAMFG
ncbi:MAG: cysteine desulfurase [Bacteroidales bacterium]|nr:cysteine desulfurase [Bacteroidales bacterium]